MDRRAASPPGTRSAVARTSAHVLTMYDLICMVAAPADDAHAVAANIPAWRHKSGANKTNPQANVSSMNTHTHRTAAMTRHVLQ